MGRLAGDGIIKMVPSPDGETIFQIDDAGRRALDYYKNNALHFLAPSSIVALAIVADGSEPASDEAVKARARRLSRLLKLEFAFRVETDFDANFRAAAQYLESRRLIDRVDGAGGPGWAPTVKGRGPTVELAGLLAVRPGPSRRMASSTSPPGQPLLC